PNRLSAATESLATDHTGTTGEDGFQQAFDVLRVVLQVGVQNHHVLAGGRLHSGADRGTLATVARMHHQGHPRIVHCAEHLGGAVAAAVVDNHELDLARIVDVQGLFDGSGDACLFVEH